MPHIQQIKITKFWGKYDIDWTLDPQVNILFGFNGSGKTTLINSINEILWKEEAFTTAEEVLLDTAYLLYDNQEYIYFDKHANPTSRFSNPLVKSTFDKIATFDVYTSDDSQKKSVSSFVEIIDNSTPLYKTLQTLVYGDGTSHTDHFEKYRSQRLDLLDEGKKEEADKIEQNTQLFYEIVNDFFAVSEKKIKFKEQKMFFENEDKKIELEQLSSGEKQLIIILLNVLLQDKKDYILLMDEPEISLHITWQQMLIEKILLLNPNCQLIIATHSPSVFGKGWRDKIVRMEELLTVSK